jgi:AGCS family alanine or glycine:cation symporter
MIFKMAFSLKSVGGGLCGSLVASMTQAIRFGVARGVFSNEAGMGSAAITAAAATTDDPVRQGYINMTGTFWDTIVVCTITGLCIASSGMLGKTEAVATGTYSFPSANSVEISSTADGKTSTTVYDVEYKDSTDGSAHILLTPQTADAKGSQTIELTSDEDVDINEIYTSDSDAFAATTWQDDSHNEYTFREDGSYEYGELLTGSALTIAAFRTVLKAPGGWLVCIGITLFAFSTILGWEYHGEKAFEYLLNTHKFNMVYRIFFSLIVYLGATTTLQIAWNFSDIANALMAIPNLICLLALSGTIAKEMNRFQSVIREEKAAKKAVK